MLLIIIIIAIILSNQLPLHIIYEGAINDFTLNYIKHNFCHSRVEKDILYVGDKIITKTKYDLFYKYIVDDFKSYDLTSYNGRIFRWSKMAKLINKKLGNKN